MTNTTAVILFAAASALATTPSAAHAQFPHVPNPVSFGVTGGLAVPAGTLGDNVNSGYSVGGIVDLHPAPGPLSLRLEVGYDRFDTKSSTLDYLVQAVGDNITANTHFLRGTANLVYRLSNVSGIRPYVTGGVGVYQIGGSSSYSAFGETITQNDQSLTKFGVNGGLGIELPLAGITPYLEVRAHGVQTDGSPFTYIPITVGFRF